MTRPRSPDRGHRRCEGGGGAHIYHLAGFARWRLRRRNPGPPPFSSMNSTPRFDTKKRNQAAAGFSVGIFLISLASSRSACHVS
jgi:hypothetical protein